MARVIPPRRSLIRPRRVRKPASFILDPTHPLSRGLVGFYPLGDTVSGKSTDISQYGKHATVNVTSGAPVLSPARNGGLAYDANAGTNFLTASPVVTTVPVSFSVWARCTSLPSSGAEQVMVALNAVGSLNEIWLALVNNAGAQSIRVVVQQSGVARWYIVAFNDATNWHHYVGVCNDINTYTIYIDGVVQAAIQLGSTIFAPTGIDTASIAGFNYNTSSYYGQWSGQLDGARIYNRALTPAEAAHLYAEPYAGVCEPYSDLVGTAAAATRRSRAYVIG